ncbi:MAG: hypothetical protein Q9165_004887 [Trypethelium subeluteriae]
MTTIATHKPIHTVVLDAGPIIRNDPSVSSLLSRTERIVTVPSVISEIRDAATRSRVETLLLPFLIQRTPKPDSINFIKDFSRKTGDLSVLSQPDLQILALSYELECELNGGDWRLRKEPGQKRMNGAPPAKISSQHMQKPEKAIKGSEDSPIYSEGASSRLNRPEGPEAFGSPNGQSLPTEETSTQPIRELDSEFSRNTVEDHETEISEAMGESSLSETHDETHDDEHGQPTMGEHLKVSIFSKEPSSENATEQTSSQLQIQSPGLPIENEDTNSSPPQHDPSTEEPLSDGPNSDSSSDSEGWITPSNIAKHKAHLSNPQHSTSSTSSPNSQSPTPTLQLALLTTDYAMQNVALRLNLNLLSPQLSRITVLKSHILRCHACFATTREVSRQFCPRCGGAKTLTRVSCSTSSSGEVVLHLKRNMQWNKRGNRFAVPKPVEGSASGRVRKGGGGGKGGWGKGLVLAEDQKEYQRAVGEEQRRERRRERDLMDEDALPGILSGERRNDGGGGRVKVGVGRDVNSRRR